MNYRETRELYVLFYGMASSAMLGFFAMVMIALHPGQAKMAVAEKFLWINILSNLVTLWLKSPGSDNKKDADIAIDSKETNVLTTENIQLTQENKHGKSSS